MREIRTSGSMSGEGKRSGDLASTAPLLDSTHVIRGTIWKHNWEYGGDFRGSRVVLIRGGGKRCLGGLIRKDLPAEIGTRPPVDIFCNEAPAYPLFHARNGTAWSWA
jgi:hypothetical protein